MRILILGLLFISYSNLIAKDYNIEQYGAISGGKVMCTSFIQNAINEASQNGGGRVIIPKGSFLSGTIHLKSNVSLILEKNAKLLGSLNHNDYEVIKDTDKTERYKWRALILAEGSTNISISGKGIINGRGDELALALDSLFYAGKLDSLEYNFIEKRPKWFIRPQLIYFYKCVNIRVSNVTLTKSACWVQTYEKCNGIVVEGVKVESDTYWNNDGLDLIDSKNVHIKNCTINSADDGICLKSESYFPNEFCDSILIENCTVRSSASAVKFGTGSLNHIRNVVVRNIKVYDTYRSAIAIEAVQGGVLENILVENIIAKNTGNAIFMRIGRIRNVKNPGVLRNVTIRDVKVTVPFINPDYQYTIRGPELPYFHNVFPSSITGIPGHRIEDVTLENIKIIYPGRGMQAYASMPLNRIAEIPELVTSYPEFSMFGELPAWGFYVRHADGITMKNVKIKIRKPDYRPAMVFDDVNKPYIENLKIKGDDKPNPLFFKDVNDAIIN